MQTIKNVENNNLYRIGDCVLYNRDLCNSILQHKSQFQNTFLYRYALLLNQIQPSNKLQSMSEIIPYQLGSDERIALAARIVAAFVKTGRYTIPPQNALIIHLRLGDNFKTGSEGGWSGSKPPDKKYIMNMINTFNGNKIIFVTVFNNETKNNELINDRGKIFLINLLKDIPPRFKVLFNSSNNIDDDFIYLCCAKNLVVGGNSGFGTVAGRINKLLKGEKNISRWSRKMI